MKKYILILTVLFSLPAFAAEFKSAEEVLKKLGAYKTEDIDGDAKRLEKKEKLKIDEMFDDLEAASKFLDNHPVSEDIALEMERVCLITFLHDPTTFAADLILAVYAKNQELFKKAAKQLHPFDMGIVLEVLDSKNEVSKNGQN